MSAEDRLNRALGDTTPSGVPSDWSPALDRLNKALGVAGTIGKAGRKAARQAAFDLVGGTLNTLGAAISTPKAALIKAISGNKTPVAFSPTASLEQFKELKDRMDTEGNVMAHPLPYGLLPSPGVMDIATDIPFASGLNAIGKHALLPAGRALANAEIGSFRARAIPGVKQALDFTKVGASLPNKYRDTFYKVLQEAEGHTDWRAFMRQENIGFGHKLNPSVQDKIAHAIETKTIGSLDDDLQGLARRIQTENRNMIADRLRNELMRGELSGAGGKEPLGYAARMLTPAGKKGRTVVTPEGPRALSPFGEPFDAGPSGLLTTTGKARTEAGRASTAQELGLTGASGKVLPLVEGTLAKGAQNDRAIMHAKIIRTLDQKFGHEIGKGESAISSIAGVPQGFNATEKARLATRALPKELHGAVAQLSKTFQPEEWNAASEFIRGMNDKFRKFALLSPGFVSRNWQNNLVQTTMFGLRDPKYYYQSHALLSKLGRGTYRLNPSELAEAKAAIKNGVIGKGFIAEETGKPGGFFEGFRNFNQKGEDIFRLAFWKYKKAQGMGDYEAAQEVNKILFNYSPTYQSRGFRFARRNVMPFINWQVNAPQLFVRSALERPGSFGMVGAIQGNLNEANSTPEARAALPEWMKPEGWTAVAKDTYLNPQMVGQYDAGGPAEAVAKDVRNVEKMTSGKAIMGSAMGREIASMSYPQWSLASALYTGVDPYTGYPIRDWGKFLIGKVPQARIPGLVRDAVQNKPGWKNKAWSFALGIGLRNAPTE